MTAYESGLSPLEQWRDAYAFLEAEDRWPEVLCDGAAESEDGEPVVHPTRFLSFEDEAEYAPYLKTRSDPDWDTYTGEFCFVSVPGTVPYGRQIDEYLDEHGFWFYDTSSEHPGLTLVEVAYPGPQPSHPEWQYRETPGLWALHLALYPIEAATDSDESIVQPTTDEEALEWLEFSRPLLDWYGYDGSFGGPSG